METKRKQETNELKLKRVQKDKESKQILRKNETTLGFLVVALNFDLAFRSNIKLS